MDAYELIIYCEKLIKNGEDEREEFILIPIDYLQNLLEYAKDGIAWEEIKGELYG